MPNPNTQKPALELIPKPNRTATKPVLPKTQACNVTREPQIVETLMMDPCGGLVLAVAVLVVGCAATGQNQRLRSIGASIGGIVFLLTMVCGLVSNAVNIGNLALLSVTGACAAVGATWILTPFIVSILNSLLEPLRVRRERQREDERRRYADLCEQQRYEAQRCHEQEMARLKATHSRPEPPRPPTEDERIADAKRQYEARLRTLETAGLNDVELSAARQYAKEKYLRELENILK